MADIHICGFDSLLVVVDDDQVAMADRAELVASAARDADSIHRGAVATVEIAGNGYQVQLHGCRVAGFHEGDRAPVLSRQGVLVIHDGTNPRLAEDLATIRTTQVSS